MMNHRALIPMAFACAFLSSPAHGQAQPETSLRAGSLVGQTDAADRQSLRSQGWILRRRASTGVRGWSDWSDANALRKIVLEEIDGKIISATLEPLSASSPKPKQTPAPGKF